jgi:SAM-dependent methyltransferase
MVLHHHRLTHQSFFYEWCFEQRKTAATAVLRIQQLLNDNGMFLIDPNTYNVTFDHTVPCYFDFGSIRAGHCPAQSWLRTFWMGGNVMQGWMDKLGIDFARLQDLLSLSRYATYDAQVEAMGLLLVDNARRTEWSSYDKKAFVYDDPATWQGKHLAVRDLFKVFPTVPRTATDLGCNTGDYCRMMLRWGVEEVCGLDIDEKAVAELYRRSRMAALKVTAVWSDFVHTYNHFCGGTRNAHTMNDPRMDRYKAQRRFSSELVLAVAVIHHLCYWRNIGLAELAQILAGSAKKYLIIEWIPAEDSYLEGIRNKYGDDRSLYTEGNFVTAMKTFFPGVHAVQKSSPEPRRMYLFTKG